MVDNARTSSLAPIRSVRVTGNVGSGSMEPLGVLTKVYLMTSGIDDKPQSTLSRNVA